MTIQGVAPFYFTLHLLPELLRMHRYFLSVLLSATMILMLSSCCEKKIYCTSGTLDFAFTGYNRTEVRSFTLRRYAKGDQFGPVIDSAQFIYYGDNTLPSKIDTFYFQDYRTVGNLKGITADNDWAIYLPAAAKLYYVTTIFDDQNNSQLVRCNDKETNCVKNITNFSINNLWQSTDFIYVEKGKF